MEKLPKGYGDTVDNEHGVSSADKWSVGEDHCLRMKPRLVLPSSLSGVHEVFHVSMLRKYTSDPAHVVDWGEIIVDTDGIIEEGPVRILDSRDQVLRRKTLRLVKVLWQHRGVEEATWEREDTMRATYHFLFEDEGALFNIESLILELE